MFAFGNGCSLRPLRFILARNPDVRPAVLRRLQHSFGKPTPAGQVSKKVISAWNKACIGAGNPLAIPEALSSMLHFLHSTDNRIERIRTLSSAITMLHANFMLCLQHSDAYLELCGRLTDEIREMKRPEVLLTFDDVHALGWSRFAAPYATLIKQALLNREIKTLPCHPASLDRMMVELDTHGCFGAVVKACIVTAVVARLRIAKRHELQLTEALKFVEMDRFRWDIRRGVMRSLLEHPMLRQLHQFPLQSMADTTTALYRSVDTQKHSQLLKQLRTAVFRDAEALVEGGGALVAAARLFAVLPPHHKKEVVDVYLTALHRGIVQQQLTPPLTPTQMCVVYSSLHSAPGEAEVCAGVRDALREAIKASAAALNGEDVALALHGAQTDSGEEQEVIWFIGRLATHARKQSLRCDSTVLLSLGLMSRGMRNQTKEFVRVQVRKRLDAALKTRNAHLLRLELRDVRDLVRKHVPEPEVMNAVGKYGQQLIQLWRQRQAEPTLNGMSSHTELGLVYSTAILMEASLLWDRTYRRSKAAIALLQTLLQSQYVPRTCLSSAIHFAVMYEQSEALALVTRLVSKQLRACAHTPVPVTKMFEAIAVQGVKKYVMESEEVDWESVAVMLQQLKECNAAVPSDVFKQCITDVVAAIQTRRSGGTAVPRAHSTSFDEYDSSDES